MSERGWVIAMEEARAGILRDSQTGMDEVEPSFRAAPNAIGDVN